MRAYGAYIDVESDVSERLLLGGALRYEKYPAYGSTLDGKFATRLQIVDSLALRGAVSTGFRVPTAGQANLRNVTTEFQMGFLTDIATLPPTHPVAQQKGAQALTPEQSVNKTVGFVFNVGALGLTADYYNIRDQGSNRLHQSVQPDPGGHRSPARFWRLRRQQLLIGALFLQPADRGGIRNRPGCQPAVRPGRGDSMLTVVANWSDINLSRFNTDFTDENTRLQIEQGRPDSRFSATWTIRKESGVSWAGPLLRRVLRRADQRRHRVVLPGAGAFVRR